MKDRRAIGRAGKCGAQRHGDLSKLEAFLSRELFEGVFNGGAGEFREIQERAPHVAKQLPCGGVEHFVRRLVEHQWALSDVEQSCLCKLDQRLGALLEVM